MWSYNYSTELYHHGVKGMKWGVRRYQNPDGSLTAAGKKKYGKMSDDKLSKTLKKQVQKQRGPSLKEYVNQYTILNLIQV